MTPSELAAELRTRINPVYAAQLGTESYERRLCAEAIESLIEQLAQLEREMVAATIRIDNDAAELAALKSQEPVAWMMASAMDDFKRGYIVEVSREQDESDDIPLYRAAGAQHESPEQQLVDSFAKSGSTEAIYAVDHGDDACVVVVTTADKFNQAGAQERKPHANPLDNAEIDVMGVRGLEQCPTLFSQVPWGAELKTYVRQLTRTIEAAHGITGEPK